MWEQLNLNTAVLALIVGLFGWVMRDFRGRMTRIDKKTNALVTAMFYLILKDPNAPEESKRAVELAMKES